MTDPNEHVHQGPFAEKDAPRFWPFVVYRGTCFVGHEPFRTRFRLRMWWHERRCTAPLPPAERDCNGYALGSSCECASSADCPATRPIPPEGRKP